VQRALPGATLVFRPLVLFLVVVGTAACGTTSSLPPSVPTATLVPGVSESPTLEASPLEASPGATTSASPPVQASPLSAPPGPTASPNLTPSATPGGPGGPAAACFGSAQTKDFFTAIAEAVEWPVYCAVLPAGWGVDRGSGNTYNLANGGRVVIAYHTNSGAHLELREGHWCTTSASACSPHDQDLGPVDLGDLQGELMTLANGGGYVVYVDPGQVPSWTVTGSGMDDASFRTLLANLALVRA
jgi:hypothetical protein